MSTPKKFYATRDFNDAGTGKAITQGDEVTSEAGLANYVAAGLASDQRPASGRTRTRD